MNIMEEVIQLGTGRVSSNNFGNKAHVLDSLAHKGFCVPNGVAVSKNYFFRRNELDFSVFCDMLWDKLKEINCLPAIVRSSACDEDNENLSYAGIYESIYPINTKFELQEAITKVWDSYFSNQAIQYRNNTEHRNAGMSLICQRWIDADISGVAFTCHPVFNDTDCIFIEAVIGSNETIESGANNYITYEIDKATGIIKRQKGMNHVGCKNTIVNLFQIITALQKEIPYYSDIEWIVKNETIHILQVRPITTIKNAEDDRYFVTPSINEHCCLLDRYSKPASHAYLSLLNYWQNIVYLDMKTNREGQYIEDKPLLFFYNRVYWNIKYQNTFFDLPYKTLDEIEKQEPFLYHQIKTLSANWYGRLPEYKNKINFLQRRVQNANDKSTIAELLHDSIYFFCDFIGKDHYQILGAANLCYKLLQNSLEENGIPKNDASKWLQKRCCNMTTESNNELLQLVACLKKDTDLCEIINNYDSNEILKIMKEPKFKPFNRMFTDFISKHGHRGTQCDDLYYPHWGEEPNLVIKLMQQFCQLREFETEKNENAAPISNSGKFEEILNITLDYMALREDQRYYFDLSWSLLRKIYLKIGSMMNQAGIIDDVQDIFHLEYDEIMQALVENGSDVISKKIVSIRQRNFRMAAHISVPLFINNGEPVYAQKNVVSSSYKVTIASKGYAVGPCRIIKEYGDLHKVNQGDILIVSTFHPSWTPILKLAAGMVMNYGNILSHGAVVVREYCLPLVIFNGAADDMFFDDQEIELDAVAGRIRLLKNNVNECIRSVNHVENRFDCSKRIKIR